jgi:hypothetical protein
MLGEQTGTIMGPKTSSYRGGFHKRAEDALNPAQISAGTTPLLQDPESAGGNPVLSQGSEVGEDTPDTRGGDPGRSLITSIEAAINATKREAKVGPKADARMWLNAPMHSREHDPVLHNALENASSAGVKISAKQLLQKYASQSPQHAAFLRKIAQGMAPPPAMAAQGAPAAMPPTGGMGNVPAPQAAAAPVKGGSATPMPGGDQEQPYVPESALAAAAQGVSPEDLAAAEALLNAQSAQVAQPSVQNAAVPTEGSAGV